MSTPIKRDPSPIVTIDGVSKTAHQWADDKGLNWGTVLKRHQNGETWEEALRPPRRGSAFRGSNQGIISAAAAKRTVGRKPVSDRDELPLAEQIKTITVTVDGETKTVEEWMAINGVNLAVLRKRRKYGATWLESIRTLKEAKEARHQAHHRTALAAKLDNDGRKAQPIVIPQK